MVGTRFGSMAGGEFYFACEVSSHIQMHALQPDTCQMIDANLWSHFGTQSPCTLHIQVFQLTSIIVMFDICTTGDIPAAAYTPHANFPSSCTPLQHQSQPSTDPLQNPQPPQTTLASSAASLAVPSTGWPILTPSSGRTNPAKLQTELTKLQTPGHPDGSAKWSLTPRWSDADARAAATAPRHISFEGSIPVSIPFTSVLPLSARAEGVFSCAVVPRTDAMTAVAEQSGSTRKRKRAAERGGTAQAQQAQHAQQAQQAQHAQHAQQAQHAEGCIGIKSPVEAPDRAVKRSQRGLRALNEHPEMPYASLASQTRELRAMTSVKGSCQTTHPRSQGESAERDEAAEAGRSRADQHAAIVMETTIQQLQFELMVGSSEPLPVAAYLPCSIHCTASFLQVMHPYHHNKLMLLAQLPVCESDTDHTSVQLYAITTELQHTSSMLTHMLIGICTYS